ncbi:alpha/beta hydrolase [Euzebya tangerina]|uniref:alpha/beta hydrolase n=1 Tax=Euzebya tangerina TaxID=591198 RepID=UPI000E32012E|nr:alpha/beta hydrolase [Euzebya tangerina]
MTHSTDQFLAAGGVTIFTQTWLPAEDPSAVVILSHGFGEHSGRYGHVAAALVEAGYAVAALDHRGHGRSGGPRAYVKSISDLSNDFAMFRDIVAQTVKPGEDPLPQILLGHSMGSAVIVDHLVGPHDPVAAVVLSGPYLRNAAEVAAPLKVLAPILGRVAGKLPTQALDSGDVSRDPAVVAAYDADPLVFHGKIPAGTGATLLGLEDALMPKASRITEPLLIVHGTEDRLAAVDGARALAGAVGSQIVDLKTYDGLHHEVFNEPEQDTVLADVVAWLAEQV